MKILLNIVFLVITTLSVAQDSESFKNANALYTTGDYSGAIKAYNSIVKTNTVSAALFFNLANAHYKLNNTAQSIYYFEKALQLNPNDHSIKQNLVFANNMKIDAIEVLPEIGYSKYFNKFAKCFKTDTWAILSVSSSILFVVSMILYFFTSLTRPKRLYFITSLALLLVGLTCLGTAFYKSNNIDNKIYAIVFAKESQLKVEANFKSEDVLTIHEGTKVLVLEKDKDWMNIKLSDGKTAWILKDDLKLLKNF